MTQALSKGVSASGKYEKKILALVFNNLGAGTPAHDQQENYGLEVLLVVMES